MFHIDPWSIARDWTYPMLYLVSKCLEDQIDMQEDARDTTRRGPAHNARGVPMIGQKPSQYPNLKSYRVAREDID